jgi:hypothetical protein
MWVGDVNMMPAYGSIFQIGDVYMMPLDVCLPSEVNEKAAEKIPMSVDMMPSFFDSKERWKDLFAHLVRDVCLKPINLLEYHRSSKEIVHRFSYYAKCLKLNQSKDIKASKLQFLSDKNKAKVLQKTIIRGYYKNKEIV